MNIPMIDNNEMVHEAVSILSQLIAIPSVSRDEEKAADFIFDYLQRKGANPQRHHNNVWCEQPVEKEGRPTLLLNAHIDTVKLAPTWQHDPFTPTVEEGKLYGLGSNDCGGGLVSLMLTFLSLRTDKTLPYHLVFLASAEEEVSGRNGIEAVLPLLPPIDVALVGEPTGMRPAIAEKGLMVLDCTAHGVSGHAARNEGVNAIMEAIKDINWLSTYQYERQIDLLGPVKTTVTIIQAGTQHNVIPDTCKYTVDVRANECYSNEELLSIIRQHVKSDVMPRSTRLHSSRIDVHHPLVQAVIREGRTPFGSPTLSDQALMRFPSFKMGPGESSRSHTADEYICFSEIADALTMYRKIIKG